jgi:3-oxoacyl-[acyl-carrier protein] reductase
LVRQWALTLPAHFHVTVNAVAPDPVLTHVMKGYEQLFDSIKNVTLVGNRIATVDDMAKVAGFLAEEGSRWINGQCTQANVGLFMI